jgi:DNA-binding transcriptional LysR family regulator
MNAQTNSWDDLRLVLALVRGGGLSGAARLLGVNHTTVLRRLNTAEQRLGAKLFERMPTGYAPTAAGEEMAEVAAHLEEDILAIERRVAGRDVRLSGTVRCATVDGLADFFLAPLLAAFQDAYPGIVVELLVSERTVNLTRRDADVAIRPTNTPPETLIGRRVGRMTYAVYGHVRYLATIADAGDPSRYRWLGVDEALAGTSLGHWQAAHVSEQAIVLRSNSLKTLLAAVDAGMGVALLPRFFAERLPDLRPILPQMKAPPVDLWILTHPDARRSARVRAFTEFMGERIHALGHLLEGRDGAIEAT